MIPALKPPRDEAELRCRAAALAGLTLADLARALGCAVPRGGVRTKGAAGALLERALGATAGSTSRPDFPHLGIELKTIPVDVAGAPQESTFVCSISLSDADRAEWETSRARAKLACVLWVPIIASPGRPSEERRLGVPRLWRPTDAQERVLRADFEDLMGLIGIGAVEALTAHAGRWLQVRPKAASGRSRTLAFGRDGEMIAALPRGFYLRPSFTGAILSDPAAIPA
ncbi:DNA mismatch repair endonuclease MutH [Sorangium atrum]|uniref:DNA mismatch repair endonuclease MutH n=1 Tax=Sorangium atrum TaxID=2995308 RepID=A0ABT5C487_9BACT|nr:DNA mismatch repair endonuclease MutH [Sorangium aterium]MDC0681177.1 DNA mismatch repair endonuclease MutH [Sorangium aterium]